METTPLSIVQPIKRTDIATIIGISTWWKRGIVANVDVGK